MNTTEFAPSARVELHAAADRYEREVLPTSAPLWPGLPAVLAVHRRVVRGFPFALAFRVLDHKIRVEAVAHTRRRPGYWLHRLDS